MIKKMRSAAQQLNKKPQGGIVVVMMLIAMILIVSTMIVGGMLFSQKVTEKFRSGTHDTTHPSALAKPFLK